MPKRFAKRCAEPFTDEDDENPGRTGHLVRQSDSIQRLGTGVNGQRVSRREQRPWARTWREGKQFGHVPVLLQQAIEFLAVRRGGTYIDATLGLGGHSWEIAKRLGAPGRLIGFDKDPAALERARERLMQPPPELAATGRRSSWCMRRLRKWRSTLRLPVGRWTAGRPGCQLDAVGGRRARI